MMQLPWAWERVRTDTVNLIAYDRHVPLRPPGEGSAETIRVTHFPQLAVNPLSLKARPSGQPRQLVYTLSDMVKNRHKIATSEGNCALMIHSSNSSPPRSESYRF